VIEDAGWMGRQHPRDRPLSNRSARASVAAVVAGEGCRTVAARFGVEVSSVTQRYRVTGSVSADKIGAISQATAGSHTAPSLRTDPPGTASDAARAEGRTRCARDAPQHALRDAFHYPMSMRLPSIVRWKPRRLIGIGLAGSGLRAQSPRASCSRKDRGGARSRRASVLGGTRLVGPTALIEITAANSSGSQQQSRPSAFR
jgi:DNA-binding transcriptional regulator YdaS (Cro superfamily)